MTDNILTPQQMRALADQHDERAQWTAEGESGRKWFRDTAAALRTAADQLEAVQDRDRISSAIGAVLFNVSNYPPSVSYRLLGLDIGPLRAKVTDAVLAILTADPAPQEPSVGHYEGDTFVPHYPQEGRDD